MNYEVEVGYVKVCVPAPSSTAYVMHDNALFACTGMAAQQFAGALLSMPRPKRHWIGQMDSFLRRALICAAQRDNLSSVWCAGAL